MDIGADSAGFGLYQTLQAESVMGTSLFLKAFGLVQPPLSFFLPWIPPHFPRLKS
jgi:hypothetical protein